MLAVKVENLVKRYGSYEALKGISFDVEEGEIFGLVGPNGAGKTTTLRILATLLTPTSGRVFVYGFDVVKDAARVREIISYLPEEAGTYKNLSGYEYLSMVARIYFKNRRDMEEALELGIKIANLGDKIYDKMKTYSRGMQRRIQLARALMVRPKLAILDEPTTGLDVVQAIEIRNVIKRFSRELNVTVVMSSHNMLEVQEVCDRVAIIDRGVIRELGYVNELLSKYGVSNLEEVFLKVVKNESTTSAAIEGCKGSH